jgi:hypothetical protein
MPFITVHCAPREHHKGYYALQRFFPTGETGPILVTDAQLEELKSEPDRAFLAVTSTEYTEEEERTRAMTDAEKAKARAAELWEAAEKADEEAKVLAKAAKSKKAAPPPADPDVGEQGAGAGGAQGGAAS